MTDALLPDLRGSATWRRVEEHFRLLLEPTFGSPAEPCEPTVSADGSTVACTCHDPHRSRVADAPRRPRRRGRRGRRGRAARCVGTPAASVPERRNARRRDRSRRTRVPHPALVVDGEVVDLPRLEGVCEHLAWSPDGAHLLALVAEPGADAAGAQGSGRLSRGDAPAWLPVVLADRPVGGWRRLWRLTLGDDGWVPCSPAGTTCWEAAWAGPALIVAVVSDHPAEAAWFAARFVAIDDAGMRDLVTVPIAVSASPPSPPTAPGPRSCRRRAATAPSSPVT